MKCSDLDVVVAGAGIGGAATALLLARAGARVRLIERVAEPRAVGAAILLQPNGLGVLYGLGLEVALRAAGTELRRGGVVDARGRLLLASPIPDFGLGLDHALVLRRSDLFGVLLGAVQQEPRITLALGATVAAATPAGHVRLTTDGRGDDAAVVDMVVAADGAQSCLRSAGSFGARVARGVTYVRALGPSRSLPGIMEYWTPLGLFGAAPLRDATYCYSSCRAAPLADAVARRDLAAFAQAWAAVLPLAGESFGALDGFDALLVNDVLQVECASFVDGRVALLGDAAHAMSPNLGQGANSALVDAAVLVDGLRRAPELGSALRTYDARRRPAVRRVQRTAAAMAWICEPRGRAFETLRDTGVRWLGHALGGERGPRAAQQEDPAWLRGVAAAAAGG